MNANTANHDLAGSISRLIERAVALSSGQKLQLPPDARLLSDGLLDSLSMLSVVTMLHEEYGIELTGADITEQNFGSVAALTRLVRSFFE